MIKTCQRKGCNNKYVRTSNVQKYCNELECIIERRKAQATAYRLVKKERQDVSRRKTVTSSLPIQKCRYCPTKFRGRFDVCPKCREYVIKGYTPEAILYNSFDYVNV